MLGIFWKSAIYLDKAAVMGCQTAPYICQHVTNLIWHVMTNLKYFIKNYMDGFMGLELKQHAEQAYNTLDNLL